MDNYDFDLPILFYPKIEKQEDGTYAILITATDPSHVYGHRLTTTVTKFMSFLEAQEFVGESQLLLIAQHLVKDAAHRALFVERPWPLKYTHLPDDFGAAIWCAATHITHSGPRAGRIVNANGPK